MMTDRRVGVALAALIIAIAARLWLIEIVTITSESMTPGLWPGDVVLVTRTSPDIGDVILYELPGQDVRYVKRVVAGPGQRVEVVEGRLFVDGEPRTGAAGSAQAALGCERRVVEGAREVWGGQEVVVMLGGTAAPQQLPPGHLFALGDHRVASSDSRQWGPLAVEDVEGVAKVVLWSSDPCGAGPRWFRIGHRVR